MTGGRRRELIFVRSLAESDLGLFAAHRSKATSRQRAVNINSAIAQRLLSRGFFESNGGEIECVCVYRGVKIVSPRYLGKIHKNWRLGGEKIEGDAFAELDCKDFMLVRSIVKNDGTHPISMTFVGRKADRVVHAGIAAIVQKVLRKSMVAYETGEPGFDDLARHASRAPSVKRANVHTRKANKSPGESVMSEDQQRRLL
jgi:hypothetical protein